MKRGAFTLCTREDTQIRKAITDLYDVLQRRAIMRGKFKLAAGGESDFYINCRKASMAYEGMAAIGQCVIQYLIDSDIKATVVAGPESAGIPLVSAALMVGHNRGYHFNGHGLEGCYIRKEAKQHGTKSLIEGAHLTEADRVLMLEDVVTSGGSVIKAIEAVKETGAQVVQVLALVDRLEGAGEKIQGMGVPFAAFHDITTLGLVGVT